MSNKIFAFLILYFVALCKKHFFFAIEKRSKLKSLWLGNKAGWFAARNLHLFPVSVFVTEMYTIANNCGSIHRLVNKEV